ncbi:MAG: HNH endonuclease signature motif containing protein [Caldilineaceae bacterium]
MAISAALRQRLLVAARFRCGYCLTQELVSGIPLTIEHIIPRSRNGSDDEPNLWISCRLCNEGKGSLIEAADPETETNVPLFNPRTQLWSEHFAWSTDGTQVLGRTIAGRATIAALSLNSEFRVRSRAIWVEAGWHPPAD